MPTADTPPLGGGRRMIEIKGYSDIQEKNYEKKTIVYRAWTTSTAGLRR